MTNEELTARLARPRFPRSSRYDGRWIMDNMMGPHVLWLAEYLSEALDLKLFQLRRTGSTGVSNSSCRTNFADSSR